MVKVKDQVEERGPPCPITGGAHQWKLTQDERYISRGDCDCHAVRFFANSFEKEALKRVEILNREKGKEGDVNTRQEAGLEPLPARPDTASMNAFQRNMVLHEYYEANQEQIIKELDVLGEKALLKRWKISPSGWLTMRAKWLPDRFTFPSWYVPIGQRRGLITGKKGSAAKKPAPAPGAAAEKEEVIEERRYACAICGAGFDDRDSLMDHSLLHGLPGFPEFNPKWKKAVQLKWLETYRELAARR